MSKMIAGWHLPAGINVEAKPVLVPADDWRAVAQLIGGGCQYIDCIRVGAYNTDTEEAYTLVGYVDDDGIANEQDINFLATVMFQRTDFIVGDCYVFNGNNPATGEYDGECYDIPDAVTETALEEITAETANQYNNMIMLYSAAQVAIERGVLEYQDFVDMEKPEQQTDMIRFLLQYAGTVANSMETADDDLDDIIDNELKAMLDDN
jgi:hypothetical protein